MSTPQPHQQYPLPPALQHYPQPQRDAVVQTPNMIRMSKSSRSTDSVKTLWTTATPSNKKSASDPGHQLDDDTTTFAFFAANTVKSSEPPIFGGVIPRHSRKKSQSSQSSVSSSSTKVDNSSPPRLQNKESPTAMSNNADAMSQANVKTFVLLENDEGVTKSVVVEDQYMSAIREAPSAIDSSDGSANVTPSINIGLWVSATPATPTATTTATATTATTQDKRIITFHAVDSDSEDAEDLLPLQILVNAAVDTRKHAVGGSSSTSFSPPSNGSSSGKSSKPAIVVTESNGGSIPFISTTKSATFHSNLSKHSHIHPTPLPTRSQSQRKPAIKLDINFNHSASFFKESQSSQSLDNSDSDRPHMRSSSLLTSLSSPSTPIFKSPTDPIAEKAFNCPYFHVEPAHLMIGTPVRIPGVRPTTETIAIVPRAPGIPRFTCPEEEERVLSMDIIEGGRAPSIGLRRSSSWMKAIVPEEHRFGSLRMSKKRGKGWGTWAGIKKDGNSATIKRFSELSSITEVNWPSGDLMPRDLPIGAVSLDGGAGVAEPRLGIIMPERVLESTFCSPRPEQWHVERDATTEATVNQELTSACDIISDYAKDSGQRHAAPRADQSSETGNKAFQLKRISSLSSVMAKNASAGKSSVDVGASPMTRIKPSLKKSPSLPELLRKLSRSKRPDPASPKPSILQDSADDPFFKHATHQKTPPVFADKPLRTSPQSYFWSTDKVPGSVRPSMATTDSTKAPITSAEAFSSLLTRSRRKEGEREPRYSWESEISDESDRNPGCPVSPNTSPVILYSRSSVRREISIFGCANVTGPRSGDSGSSFDSTSTSSHGVPKSLFAVLEACRSASSESLDSLEWVTAGGSGVDSTSGTLSRSLPRSMNEKFSNENIDEQVYVDAQSISCDNDESNEDDEVTSENHPGSLLQEIRFRGMDETFFDSRMYPYDDNYPNDANAAYLDKAPPSPAPSPALLETHGHPNPKANAISSPSRSMRRVEKSTDVTFAMVSASTSSSRNVMKRIKKKMVGQFRNVKGAIIESMTTVTTTVSTPTTPILAPTISSSNNASSSPSMPSFKASVAPSLMMPSRRSTVQRIRVLPEAGAGLRLEDIRCGGASVIGIPEGHTVYESFSSGHLYSHQHEPSSREGFGINSNPTPPGLARKSSLMTFLNK
ncbi:hypothetical protein HDU76_002669 [Blyttiomyces sp. JEL0837]|nr:hypothetical protein HDU76_002669 [Blyttiomyces sp. JEL0837]